MDFKKIKPNDMLGFLDDLVSKIPESISSLLTKVMIGILALSMIYAVYYGYMQGYGNATQEGQELAKDTKSLFLEDIEREYNRKHKNIRMPSADSLISDEMYETPKNYESYGRQQDSGSIANQPDSYLENDKSIRAYKRSGNTSPLAELETTDPERIPYGQERQDSQDKPRRRLQLKDNFDTPLSNSETKGMDSILDQVYSDPNPESKILDRSKSEKKKRETRESNEMNTMKKESDKLQEPEKSSKQEKKRKLLPIDGME